MRSEEKNEILTVSFKTLFKINVPFLISVNKWSERKLKTHKFGDTL